MGAQVSIEMSIGMDDPDYKPDLSVDLPELSATRKASAGPRQRASLSYI